MKRLIQVTALSLSLVALNGCKNVCKQLTNEVLQPTSAAEGVLSTVKSGADVTTSCPALLDAIKTLPEGAQTIRDVAARKFTESYSTCVQWVVGTRWDTECHGGWHHENCVSYPYHYSYCAAYEHHTTHDAGYSVAMDLSAHLDVAFAKANEVCGNANSGNTDAALALAKDLQSYLTNQVKPESDQVYALACN